ncbi:PP2C family protein-serine/threonine phosphatase [Polymorphospora rubra]|uniref:PP2C family protein-serine/threonine phosphatase n=1 Tax=Polymorphospora rubra TaxID=338584 RepID=UPI0024849BC1|nr:SpoIIE family protein phosphatase [Polymorphospora rubra]
MADADAVPNLPGKLARFLDGRTDGRSADLTPVQLHPGDRILLCSDGLSSYVPQESVRNALDTGITPEEVAEHLVTLALDHGGRDNVTVIVIDVHQ